MRERARFPVTVAVCTYNRSERLPALVRALRSQTCDLQFRILFVNNNSTDATASVLASLQPEPGPPLDVVLERAQGIVPARNRAIEECLDSLYMVVMDDDELPHPGWVQAAVRALRDDDAECAGGRIRVSFAGVERPRWLGDDLLGFLAEVNHGSEPFWIRDDSTPVWTSNIAYRTGLFRDGLRYDIRYTRVGRAHGISGEDWIMFTHLLQSGVRIRYVPEMAVDHFVERWRLQRQYFLRLHYSSGFKQGLYETRDFARTVCGVPPFFFGNALRHGARALRAWLANERGALRQAMNFMHGWGMIAGRFARWRKGQSI